MSAHKDMTSEASTSPWRPPTRRAFVAMLGAAAAALAVRESGTLPEQAGGERGGRRRARTSKTIWIGHC